MARLVYALTGEGRWDVHRAGCTEMTSAARLLRYQSDPTEFEAGSAEEARAIVCDGECQDLGYDPDLDVDLYPCASAALAAAGAVEPAGTTIIVGFTRTDRNRGYIPVIDGYRAGAAQDVHVVTVAEGLCATAVEVADAVFVAIKSSPSNRLSAVETAVRDALATDPWLLRNLAVGDTVTVDGVTVASAPLGWETVASTHDCRTGGQLTFVAVYVGQSWRCRFCDRDWALVGGKFYPPEAGAHLLRHEDVV